MNEEYMSSEEIRAKIAELKIRLAFQLEFEKELEETLRECERADEAEKQAIKKYEPEIIRKIQEAAKRERCAIGRRRAACAGKVLAVAAVLLTISFGSAFAAIRMVEAGILKLDIQPQTGNAVFRMAATPPEEWTGKYYPTYIPEEYEFGYVDEFGAHYFDREGYEFTFDEKKQGYRDALDTEDAVASNVMLNGAAAMVLEKDGWTTVVWSTDNRYFVVEIHANKAIALRMATSVSLVK